MKALRRKFFLVLAVAPLAAMPLAMGQAPASIALPSRLGSIVVHGESLPAKPTGTGARRNVVNQPTATLENLECHISTLNPGLMSHPPHRHPQEEFIILKEGTLEVFINGNVQWVGPGSVIFFASNDLHNVTNIGAGPATYQVFQLTTAATQAAPVTAAAVSAAPGTLPSGVFDWKNLAVKRTETGERRDIFDSPTVTCTRLECHATTLNPGNAPHAADRHPDEELVVVQEGFLQVTINGATQRAGPDSIIFYGSNDEHGMINVGATTATYYIFRFVTAATPAPH